MRTNSYTPFFIISAYRDGLENKLRTVALEQDLIKLGSRYTAVLGSYKGKREQAFIVYNGDKGAILTLANKYRQESVLERDIWNDCYLVYTDDVYAKPIGHFVPIDEAELEKFDNYTSVPTSEGNYLHYTTLA